MQTEKNPKLVSRQSAVSDMELSPVQRATIVDLLVHGDDKAGNIADRTGFHHNSVSRSASGLVEAGLIAHKGGGVYRLTETGTETARGLLRGGYNPWQDGD